MIIKSYEANKLDIQITNCILLYGDNEGFKNQVIIENVINKNKDKKVEKYEENEIFNNYENIISGLLNKSFFDVKKIIIITRVSDKILKFVEEFFVKNIEDTTLIINSKSLEKKSKLRNFFEKDKRTICIPFYADEINTLNTIATSFFKKLKIPISRETINIITERCNGDRNNLNNELEKIRAFLNDKSNISLDEIKTITNLAENYSISDLADTCLSKNVKRTIKILNENNFSDQDCIQIIRTILYKSKRVLKIKNICDKGKNLDEAISEYRPTIFWKDKQMVKNQILAWKKNEAEKLIIDISNIELLVKKNSFNSVNIISDFILNTSNNFSNSP